MTATFDLASLPPMDVAGRLDRLRAALAGDGDASAEALLVTKLVNIQWLTGFTGSAGFAVVRPDRALLVTDGRYRTQAAEQVAAAGLGDAVEIAIGTTMAAQAELLAAATNDLGTLALEAHAVTWADQRRYADELAPELVASVGLADRLRVEKDDGEIARIEAAAAIATEALTNVRHRLWDGLTEADFGLELDTEMRRLGATAPSFDTIVASGPNSAKPHHRPSGRRIVEGDLVVLDFGAKVDGYCSDMTRTVAIGEPTVEQQRIIDVVTEAQAAGVAAVRDGADCRAVDAACRDLITAAGWGDSFGHGTGHGVGLEIHEDPRVSPAAPEGATLVSRSVVTVEPGVYLAGIGGVRIEDSVVVTADGCRSITHAPKDPQWPSARTT
jgi:Xaa-Pro aminopeptidase